MSGSTNQVVFLLSVHECERHKGIGGVRNVSEVGLKMVENMSKNSVQ